MCDHIHMGMCWLLQENPDLLRNDTDDALSVDSDDLYSEADHIKPHGHMNSAQIQKMVDYLWHTKRIPSSLPEEVNLTVPKIPDKFSPDETCPYCPGPTPPLLEEKLFTKQGTIYGILSVNKGQWLCMCVSLLLLLFYVSKMYFFLFLSVLYRCSCLHQDMPRLQFVDQVPGLQN